MVAHERQHDIASLSHREAAANLDRLRRNRRRRSSNNRATANSVGPEDPNRLNLPNVTSFLASLADGNVTCVTLAIFSLLAPLDLRVRPLRLGGSGILPSTFSEVVVDPDSCEIRYTVERGATDFRAACNGTVPSDGAVMRLGVPSVIATTLGDLVHHDKLHSALHRLDRLAGRFHADGHCDYAPTASRLRASYWTVLYPGQFTSIEAATVAGRAPQWMGARLRYYPLDRADLNVRYRKAVRALAMEMAQSENASPSLRSFIANLTFSSNVPTGTVGSQAAVPISHLATHARFIADYADLQQQAWHRDWGVRGLPALLHALNAQHAFFYLLQQVSLGVRPPARVAWVGSLGPQFGACVGDKSDKEYFGRSYSVTPTLYLAQLSLLADTRRDVDHILGVLGCQLISVKHAWQSNVHTALHFSLGRNGRDVIVRRMTPARFSRFLATAGHPAAAQYAQFFNLVRHGMAGALHRRVPERQLDEYLGHHVAGLEMTGAWSSATRTSFSILERELERITHAIFGKCVGIRVRP